MTNQLPRGFTRGAPDKEGCYVLIHRDGAASCGISVHDVFKDGEEFFVVTHPEDAGCESFEDFEIVAYMPLEGLSAYGLWNGPEMFGIHFLKPKGNYITADEAKRIFKECLRKYRND